MSTKLYSETKKNILMLSNRQLDILKLVLVYCGHKQVIDLLNAYYWDSEEELLKVGENFIPELNEKEIENLEKLINNPPDRLLEIKAGDFIRCNKDSHFDDGTFHLEGELIKVLPSEVAYFNNPHNRQNYELLTN